MKKIILYGIIALSFSAFAEDVEIINLGKSASPDNYKNVVWFGSGDPGSALLKAQIHCGRKNSDVGTLTITGEGEYLLRDCAFHVKNLGNHASFDYKSFAVEVDNISRTVIRFHYVHLVLPK